MKKLLLMGAILFASPVFAEDCDKEKQVELLAKTMYHEARGDTPHGEGMQAVGEVVLNRVESDNFPDTVCAVILQKGQFAPQIKSGSKPAEKGEWELAVEIAEGLIEGEIETMDHGATHFLNPKTGSAGWTRKFSQVGKVGSHVFYADGSLG